MLTSLATRNVVERCLELGAVNFVRKDTPKDVMAKVLAEPSTQLRHGIAPPPMPAEDTPAGDDLDLASYRARSPLPIAPLLRELRLERTGSLFAKEILDQMEISQIFTTRRKKHARRT
jgi:hypothetical protein